MTGRIKIHHYHKITNAKTGIKTETEAVIIISKNDENVS